MVYSMKRKETEQERIQRKINKEDRDDMVETIDSFIRFFIIAVSRITVKLILPICIVLELAKYLQDKFS